jgi:hypothetical protein
MIRQVLHVSCELSGENDMYRQQRAMSGSNNAVYIQNKRYGPFFKMYPAHRYAWSTSRA